VPLPGDRQAQRSLGNALTVAKTLFTETDTDFSAVTVTSAAAVDPALGWTSGPSAAADAVSYELRDSSSGVRNGAIVLTVESESGTCFAVLGEAAGGLKIRETYSQRDSGETGCDASTFP
jgi:hypothetical protein